MIHKRNKIILFRINNINLIFLILQCFIIQYISSEQKCKDNQVFSIFYGRVTCTNICNGDSIRDNSAFYVYEQSMTCVFESCTRLFIESTSECVSSCEPRYYKLGDYCLSYDEMHAEPALNNYDYGDHYKSCKYFYYITSFQGRDKYKCYYDPSSYDPSEGYNFEKCPTTYYNMETDVGICSSNCNSQKNTRKGNVATGNIEYIVCKRG